MPRADNPITTPNQSLPPSTIQPPSQGRNSSNRPWKLRAQKRASSLLTSNTLNGRSKSWEEKSRQRQLSIQIKQAQTEMIEERKTLLREKKERRLENERRRMENEYKNAKSSMQKLNIQRLGSTMKSMNKKQLRMIKKSRMNSKTGVVEFVGAYAK